MSESILNKNYIAKVKKEEIDHDKKTAWITVSTNSVDRDREIINVKNINIEDFLKHPVMLAGHDTRNIEATIGEWKDIDIKGNKFKALGKWFAGEGNKIADWGWNLTAKGLAAVSIGFLTSEYKMLMSEEELYEEYKSGKRDWNKAVREIISCKLVEISQVGVGANQDAVQKSLKRFSYDNKFQLFVTEEMKKFMENQPIENKDLNNEVKEIKEVKESIPEEIITKEIKNSEIKDIKETLSILVSKIQSIEIDLKAIVGKEFKEIYNIIDDKSKKEENLVQIEKLIDSIGDTIKQSGKL